MNKIPLSAWERKIFKKLDSKLEVETKFRKFPLKDEKSPYVPDFWIKGFEYKDREILVEAHEEISEENIRKSRKFRHSIFGAAYYLIMIVRDGELRKWNEHDQAKLGGVFNEIWTVDTVGFLVDELIKKKKLYDERINALPQTAVCPAPPKGHGCGKKAGGIKQVEKLFGYRGKRVQSLCRKCRNEQASKRR